MLIVHGHAVGQSTVENSCFLRGNDLPPSAYTPLPQTREGVVERGVLTDEVFGAAGNGGIDGEKRLTVGAKSFGWPQ
jgi:hypothetical protein